MRTLLSRAGIARRRSMVALVGLLLASGLPTGAQAQSSRFFKDARAELALARARGDSVVVLVVASRDGENEAVARAITAAGGTVRYRADDVSYLRATVPTARVLELVATAPVESATLDAMGAGTRPYIQWPATERSTASTGGAQRDDAERSMLGVVDTTERGWPPVFSDYPLRKPYSPLADMGALELRRAHPTYDGRGVTIGHVEGHVDLLAPEFRTAYTLDGRRVHKFADYVTAVDPEYPEEPDSAGVHPWLRVDEVDASTGRFTAQGATYTAPRAGRFRFGIFSNRRLCGFLNRKEFNAVDRPGSVDVPLHCPFGVLYDERTGEVWVDVNADRSFADSRPMRDYRVRGDIGVFGKDDPRTPMDRESFGFTVQTHPSNQWVGIVVGFGGHATMVAGTVIANRVPSGRYDGIAPGARLIEIGYRASASGVAEALIVAFRDPRVDVVLFEQNAFIAQPYRLGDGRFPPTIVTSRLIARYGKPFVVPGENSPGLNATAEHGNATWGFAVGAYQGKDAYWINDGIKLSRADNFHHVGAWGPGGDGSIKPSILAPSNILSNELPSRFYGKRGGKIGLFALPAGYGIGGGTSQATPSMAGALALLISAAKQARVPYDAERIWLATTNGARHVAHFPAYKEGNGVVHVGRAFTLLQAYATRPPTVRITSRAPVRTRYSAWLATPHEGVGLWEREGWRAGMREERTITFTRTSGPSEPMTFSLSWTGNDGTFTAPSTITLPLQTPVALPITVAPARAGVHGAILSLDHPSIPGHAHRVATTIVAAHELTRENSFAFRTTDTLERPGPQDSYFIHVPPGAGALSVKLQTHDSLRLNVRDPLGRLRFGGWREPHTSVTTNPMPGVWELGIMQTTRGGLDVLWTYGDTVSPPVRFTLSATLFGAELALARSGEDAGQRSAASIDVANRFAPFTGHAVTSVLAQGRERRERLMPNEQRVYEVDVPDGAVALGAAVNAETGADGEVDVYLFDCTGVRCAAAAADLAPGGSTGVWRDRPARGRWRVVVDAAGVGDGGVPVTYTDVVLEPAIGSVVAADGPRRRELGARWTAPAQVWRAPAGTARRENVFMVLQVNATEGDPAARVARRLIAFPVGEKE